MDNLDFSTNIPQNTPDKPKRFQSCSKCLMVLPITEFPPSRRMCKACKAQWNREYYLRTRERRSAYAKQYRAENRDTINQHQREYRAANKERLNEYARQHYAANRAERIQYRKDYYRAHIEHEQASALERYAKGKARRYARILAPKKGGQS